MSTSINGGTEADHLRVAADRLTRRTAVVSSRLNQRLEAVRSVHDLSSRALLSSHRQIRHLDEMQVAPSPIEFWTITANPVGQGLVAAATPVIEEQLASFADALDRFRLSVSNAGVSPASAGARAVVAACCDRLADCYFDARPINRLGSRWQRRLRRAAIRSALPRLLMASAKEAEPIIAAAEIELLDQAPWAHDDRLLSAFELAHADIRVMLRDQVDELSVIVPGWTGRQLDTAI